MDRHARVRPRLEMESPFHPPRGAPAPFSFGAPAPAPVSAPVPEPSPAAASYIRAETRAESTRLYSAVKRADAQVKYLCDIGEAVGSPLMVRAVNESTRAAEALRLHEWCVSHPKDKYGNPVPHVPDDAAEATADEEENRLLAAVAGAADDVAELARAGNMPESGMVRAANAQLDNAKHDLMLWRTRKFVKEARAACAGTEGASESAPVAEQKVAEEKRTPPRGRPLFLEPRIELRIKDARLAALEARAAAARAEHTLDALVEAATVLRMYEKAK